jgi:hypothetical protein
MFPSQPCPASTAIAPRHIGCYSPNQAYVPVENRGLGRMNRHVLEISTHVFRLLRRRAPPYVSCLDEKDGPTQRIAVDDDVYNEIIDRAISKRKTIDQVFLEVGTRVRPTHRRSSCIKRWSH